MPRDLTMPQLYVWQTTSRRCLTDKPSIETRLVPPREIREPQNPLPYQRWRNHPHETFLCSSYVRARHERPSSESLLRSATTNLAVGNKSQWPAFATNANKCAREESVTSQVRPQATHVHGTAVFAATHSVGEYRVSTISSQNISCACSTLTNHRAGCDTVREGQRSGFTACQSSSEPCVNAQVSHGLGQPTGARTTVTKFSSSTESSSTGKPSREAEDPCETNGNPADASQ
jgi:hypothetical protein